MFIDALLCRLRDFYEVYDSKVTLSIIAVNWFRITVNNHKYYGYIPHAKLKQINQASHLQDGSSYAQEDGAPFPSRYHQP